MIESKVGVEQCNDRHLPLPAGSGPFFLKSQPRPAPAAALVIGVVISAKPGYKCTATCY